jgi:hypothetical protein
LRRFGHFDVYTNDLFGWDYNIRPKPDNFTEVREIDESQYKCAVAHSFWEFNYPNIKQIHTSEVNEPYLSPEHYHYVTKTKKGVITGGNYTFSSMEETKLFVKVVTGQKNVTFLGSRNLAICENVSLPFVEGGFLQASAISRYYQFMELLGSYTTYLNVIGGITNYNVYEAMLLGLPAVSVKTDPEFKHGVCGLFSDDPFELRSFVGYLLKNPEKAVRMGFKAKTLLEERFAKSGFHNKWRELLK